MPCVLRDCGAWFGGPALENGNPVVCENKYFRLPRVMERKNPGRISWMVYDVKASPGTNAMDPIYYLTMSSMVLSEMLICLYLMRPQWLSRSRRWRLACLYGVYLCGCSMLFVPAAVTAKISPYKLDQQSSPSNAPDDPQPLHLHWT